jgi:hypothetical protein
VAKSFVRNSVLALSIFVIVLILVYANVEITEPVTEYVSFVVTTSFSVQPILQKVGFAEEWGTWDFGSLFEGWSEATPGW